MDGLSRGAHSTLNFGECPSAASASTLSQILVANAPDRYSLSAKACAGILRRAQKRRKALPADAPGSAGGSGVAARGCLIAFHAQQDPISSEAVTPCLGGQGQATVDVVYPQVARTLEARHDSSPCIDRGQNLICIHDKATRHQGGGDSRHDDGGGNGLGVAEDGVAVYADCR